MLNFILFLMILNFVFNDVEFYFIFIVEAEELSKDMRNHGYPHAHRHKLCCLRQELIEAFVE